MKCRECHSERLVKAGLTKYRTQMYKCKDCGYRGTMTGGIIVKGRKGIACTVCGGKTTAKGLCRKHYLQKYVETRKRISEEIFCGYRLDFPSLDEKSTIPTQSPSI